jgi:hypothetical protein
MTSCPYCEHSMLRHSRNSPRTTKLLRLALSESHHDIPLR